ncbi:hypothetical protein JAO73_12815 [Hymenobacter sp. BT523]|uniref:hypothetical protein n=1 Tax=Hymenobacter sp. BT523 TaxID=2795725 RepID=UPI0018EA9852|nr:hypothetical protein [Hymenobacter sp. BT523]MBJ6109897.1 hypothetical protein [Hymenobacter sp. BT523]
MQLQNFQFTSGLDQAYPVIKFGLLVLMAFSSAMWRESRWPVIMALAAGIGLTAIGALFKIEHWTSGDEILLAGVALVAGSYAWWYRVKPQRCLLDHLKLAWVGAACASLAFLAVYPPMIRPLAGLAEALFWAMALLFVYERWMRKPKPAAPDA